MCEGEGTFGAGEWEARGKVNPEWFGAARVWFWAGFIHRGQGKRAQSHEEGSSGWLE